MSSTGSTVDAAPNIVGWAREAYAAGKLSDAELEAVIGAAITIPEPVSVAARPRRQVRWDRIGIWAIFATFMGAWHLAALSACLGDRGGTLAGVLAAQAALILVDLLVAQLFRESAWR